MHKKIQERDGLNLSETTELRLFRKLSRESSGGEVK